VIAMITTTQTDTFRAIVDDDRLLEVALLDLFEVVARRLISGRPAGDALVSLNFLMAQIERGPNK
jgi:hypothetical protein